MIELTNNIDWLNQQAEIFPEQKAVYFFDKAINYSELNENTNAIVEILRKKNVKRGSRVALICENNIDFLTCLFTLWRMKAVPVPLNIRLTYNELLEQINFLNCSHLIIQKSLPLFVKTRKSKAVIISLPLKTPKSSKSSHRRIKLNPESTALILFTSGSSSKPKAVKLSFENLYSSAVNADTELQFSPENRWIASLPFYHIGGLSIIARVLLSGSALVFPRSSNINDLISSIVNDSPTHLSLVGTTLGRICERKIKPPESLRSILLGGGPTDISIIKTALKLGWPLVKVYGSTETASMVTSFTLKNNKKKISSSGKALPNNVIYIMDEKRDELKSGEKGEVVVESPALMSGYYKNPSATKSRLINGKYFTGDMGFLDRDGFLYIVGRKDNLIISGGENIYPGEIEIALLKHPAIVDAAVFPVKDIEWGYSAAAALVVNKEISQEKIRKYLKKHLSSIKIPKLIFFTEIIPRNDLGKVNFQKLKLLLKI